MKLIWSPQAVRDLDALHDYIIQDDPKAAAAAAAVVRRIVSLVEELLPATPHVGRPGRVPGTRELVVSGTPYIVPYRVRARKIEIVRFYHAARRWPATL